MACTYVYNMNMLTMCCSSSSVEGGRRRVWRSNVQSARHSV